MKIAIIESQTELLSGKKKRRERKKEKKKRRKGERFEYYTAIFVVAAATRERVNYYKYCYSVLLYWGD